MADYDGTSRLAIRKELERQLQKRIEKLSGHDRELAQALVKSQTEADRLIGRIAGGFYGDKGKKPSQWFGQKGVLPMQRPHKALLDAFVPKGYQDSYLYIIDKLNQFPFSRGWARRTVRTAGYGPQIRQVFTLLQAYERLFYCGDRLEDVILNRLDPEKLDYIQNEWSFQRNFSYLYAAEIDLGNQAVIKALKDLILSENNTAYLDREMILGIMRSDNKELQDLLCNLLLAARLQEGLRQVICETMDEGTETVFKKLLKVIEDNDLIRFSSVKRSVSTWIGIFDETSVDRVNGKLLNLMSQCLADPAFCKSQLATSDSVAINGALWALGFHEVEDAIRAMEELVDHGTKNQRLAASFYNQNIFDEDLKIRVARKVILEQTQDMELVAAFMPAYTVRLSGQIRGLLYESGRTYLNRVTKPRKPKLTDYYTDRKEAELLYGKFMEIYQALPKKGVVYAPCIFPWYRVELAPSEVVRQLAFLAYVLEDQEKITRMAGLLGEVAGGCYQRSYLINLLLYMPSDPEQRKQLIGYMGNAEADSSAAAIELVKQMKLKGDEYLLLEDMLRFKRSSLRGTLIGLLMEQEDAQMRACLKRLLEDKREEKRSAALDMMLRLSGDQERAELYQSVRPLASTIANPTDKETLLIQELQGKDAGSVEEQKGYGIYDPEAEEVIRDIPADVASALERRDSRQELKERCLPLTEQQVVQKFKKLDGIIRENKDLEYESVSGDKELLGNRYTCLKEYSGVRGTRAGYKLEHYPLAEKLEDFYKEEIGSYRALVQMEARLFWNQDWADAARSFYQGVFGCQPFKPEPVSLEYTQQVRDIRLVYRFQFLDRKELLETGIQVVQALTELVGRENKMVEYSYSGYGNRRYNTSKRVSELGIFERYFEGLGYWETDEEFIRAFHTAWSFERKCRDEKERNQFLTKPGHMGSRYDTMSPMNLYWFLKAYHMGLVSRDILYKAVLDYFSRTQSLQILSKVVKGECVKPMNRRNMMGFFGTEMADQLYQEGEDSLGPDTWTGKLLRELYGDIVPVMVDRELRRGEAETEFSHDIYGISYIRGIPYLKRILMALGKDTLGRNTYYSWYYSNREVTKQEVLSHLLKVCYPGDGENGADLKEALKGTSIKAARLVEVAMYAPQWIDVIQEYLGWEGLKSGCYYFMAHMNERFDDQKKAMIARYTPLTPEELQDGAFDVIWFEEAYRLLGEKNFGLLYNAARYISDGIKHSRARKYADAASGKVTLEALGQEIQAKRNKDLLMSYGLVPFGENQERDIQDRYQFIQQFKKESRQFGAQRRASESKAAEIALVNLSVRAGFSDVTRLTLNVESRLAETFAPYMEWTVVDDVEIRLQVGADGKSEVLCRKGGKALKSVPSRLGKQPLVAEMKDACKKLKDQYSRTRKMMEEAMESGDSFTAGEVAGLLANPVVRAILEPLVYAGKEKLGFVKWARMADGKLVELRTEDAGAEPEAVAAGAEPEAAAAGTEPGAAAAGTEPGAVAAGAEPGVTAAEAELSTAGRQAVGTVCGKATENMVLCLEGPDGTCVTLEKEDTVRIAHPLDLYRSDNWHEYQKYLFDHEMRQPFKQVFRELYVKLPEEMGLKASRMFAGNQIQPQKTVGCLKSRRWVADYEEGLQKVYYKENIVARIYALADWFSPSDVEAPTLEWVEFSDRKTFESLTIGQVPDLIYSEVMRDVDLAVSVAHAGGVDPETSHSTIEMRRAIVEFNLPLFGLTNVTLKDSHALIRGSRGTYNVHLGSGVVHQEGGAMLNILPVHSQKRGRLFLPFVDEDPKTAEIMSKIVLLAEDKKIKDPFILEQIHR
ncbi:MAG: DUF4132 domain-containing protein [Lachnospiraceae bacterium]|nr:DUF4132 domain-containing protein [Lachnospiraceae bacterium]